MSATITIARDISTSRIFHIDDVDKNDGASFECCECRQKISPVKTESRGKDWHFRHLQTADIAKCRSTALHDFAVQVIMDNSVISISKKLQIAYTNPRKEVTVLGKRSDVAVNYANEDVHFEVFVTHDLDKEKNDIYKANKIKCVHINMSDPGWLSASPESIKEAVFNQHKNKTIIYWEEELLDVNPKSFNVINTLVGVFAAIGVVYLFKNLSRRRRREY